MDKETSLNRLEQAVEIMQTIAGELSHYCEFQPLSDYNDWTETPEANQRGCSMWYLKILLEKIRRICGEPMSDEFYRNRMDSIKDARESLLISVMEIDDDAADVDVWRNLKDSLEPLFASGFELGIVSQTMQERNISFACSEDIEKYASDVFGDLTDMEMPDDGEEIEEMRNASDRIQFGIRLIRYLFDRLEDEGIDPYGSIFGTSAGISALLELQYIDDYSDYCYHVAVYQNVDAYRIHEKLATVPKADDECECIRLLRVYDEICANSGIYFIDGAARLLCNEVQYGDVVSERANTENFAYVVALSLLTNVGRLAEQAGII